MITDNIFSVSPIKKIAFSSGNLQYCPLNKTWKITENQYDVIGENNKYIGNNYGGFIDLFNWETAQKNPLATDWRMPTTEEWRYLFHDRENADSKYGLAQVAGVNGLIVLSDSFQLPSDLSFCCGAAIGFGSELYKSVNTYTAQEFSVMETQGAVFLPCGGYRYGFGVFRYSSGGYYWTSTIREDNKVDFLSIQQCGVTITDDYCQENCHSVRLIRDL